MVASQGATAERDFARQRERDAHRQAAPQVEAPPPAIPPVQDRPSDTRFVGPRPRVDRVACGSGRRRTATPPNDDGARLTTGAAES